MASSKARSEVAGVMGTTSDSAIAVGDQRRGYSSPTCGHCCLQLS